MNSKLIIRIVCLVLVVLLVLGFVITLLPTGTPAAAGSYPATQKVAIGLMYGASATKSCALSSPGGFSLGYVHTGEFTALIENGSSALTVQSTASAYRVQFSVDEGVADFTVQYAELREIAQKAGYSAFPAFADSGLCVRAGSFSDRAAAEAAVTKLKNTYAVDCTVAAPTSSTLTVTGGGATVFEFVGSASLALGVRAIAPYYITLPDGYTYDGVMRFTRAGDAMTVVNVLPLETYVEGVLPYEISSSWNKETQKAFAVCVRSYTLANLGKHASTYDFDLCATTDCQVYRGVDGVTDTVRECVRDTRHMVLTYDGRPVGAYYSSSTGGCTASAYDVWGGTSFPYLSAIPTPWEKYSSYSNGSWTAEASPQALYQALTNKGYTGLSGAVSGIKVNSLAENSTYVNSITVTDVNGKSITISKCDRIRTALSSYVKSANFVVGRGGEPLNITDYSYDFDLSKQQISGFSVRTVYGDQILPESGGIRTTESTFTDLSSLRILTATGATMDLSAARRTVSALPDLSTATVKTTQRTVTAEGQKGNFVFVGRGWGHGVGLSQYGAKDLGDLGYGYDVILSSYFPKAELANMTALD